MQFAELFYDDYLKNYNDIFSLGDGLNNKRIEF